MVTSVGSQNNITQVNERTAWDCKGLCDNEKIECIWMHHARHAIPFCAVQLLDLRKAFGPDHLGIQQGAFVPHSIAFIWRDIA